MASGARRRDHDAGDGDRWPDHSKFHAKLARPANCRPVARRVQSLQFIVLAVSALALMGWVASPFAWPTGLCLLSPDCCNLPDWRDGRAILPGATASF